MDHSPKTEPMAVSSPVINELVLNNHGTKDTTISRLNYIGSKYQLLDWITEHMRIVTGWGDFKGRRIADLFAGTGVVSHHFRKVGAIVTSNDAELYSAIITHAFTCSSYTERCASLIATFGTELVSNAHATTAGFVTRKYSPFEDCERMFFTVDNARRIDYLRNRIEMTRSECTVDEYKFLLASLLLSADAVSNVPAVYGCYLKNFKAKAIKNLTLKPIHILATASSVGSKSYNSDVLADTLISNIDADLVYLDPPYNERQYSKNYFPLNMIALTPEEQLVEPALKGKTGIPTTCFKSPFCKKGAAVEEAFEKLFSNLKTTWIFVSYNSESIVSRTKMLEIMGKYGTVTIQEREYKRFKSFKYNKDVAIKEYLFCLRKT